MNWKHLFWIIPVVFILGAFVGFKILEYTTDTLANMVDSIDQCSVQTLAYVATYDDNCRVLASGFLQNCTNNMGVKNE